MFIQLLVLLSVGSKHSFYQEKASFRGIDNLRCTSLVLVRKLIVAYLMPE
jgi:hypothetical protein